MRHAFAVFSLHGFSVEDLSSDGSFWNGSQASQAVFSTDTSASRGSWPARAKPSGGSVGARSTRPQVLLSLEARKGRTREKQNLRNGPF